MTEKLALIAALSNLGALAVEPPREKPRRFIPDDEREVEAKGKRAKKAAKRARAAARHEAAQRREVG